MEMNDVTIVRREVEVTIVPFGDKMRLMPGQEVLVTQAKGGAFTLNVNGNLVYLDGDDADAIGREKLVLPVENYNIQPGDEINEEAIWEQLKTVYDPEIPVNIVDLGLIYDVTYHRLGSNNYHVGIQMTLTAPGCGMGPVLVEDVENRIKMIPNVDDCDVVIVFDPPWSPDMMTEEAKVELGFF